ncbi:mitochondrial carrier protein [Plasmodium gonderi]|uniref:Mitochondrial carrier protein n=1 Tax=Plasmodium gonderi TaxID=77519 RepID=A0A1Y1JC96_PLAGO|nr:mitochondrial carrier protein [Plasmodium gonderi]GAW80116.1 mitochondrial carrier protein [Plasmodium gonderi]
MNKLSVNDAFDDIEIESFDFIWEEWEEYKGDVPLWQHIFCGSIAGLMEHVFMYPLDTLKTYIQTNGNLEGSKWIYNRCNIYDSNNNGSTFNDIKVHDSNSNIDKKNICTYRGCDNCVYKKTCSYNNFCNMKAITSPFNKKNVLHARTFSDALHGIIKDQKKFRNILCNNLSVEERRIMKHIMNKKLQHRYHNKVMNKRFITTNRSNNKENSACSVYDELGDLRKNRSCNLFDKPSGKVVDSQMVGKSKNKRIHILSRNINRVGSNTLSRARSGGTEKIKEDIQNVERIKNKNCFSSTRDITSPSHRGYINKKSCSNHKKGSFLFSVSNKENNFLGSKKVTGRIIFKNSNNTQKWKCKIKNYKYGVNSETVKNYKHVQNCNNALHTFLHKMNSNKIKKKKSAELKRVYKFFLNHASRKYTHDMCNKRNNSYFVFMNKNNNAPLMGGLKHYMLPNSTNNKCHMGRSETSNIMKKTDLFFNISGKNFVNNGSNANENNRTKANSYFSLFHRTTDNTQHNHCCPSETFKKCSRFQSYIWDILRKDKKKKNECNFFVHFFENVKKSFFQNKWCKITEISPRLTNNKTLELRKDGLNSYYSLLRNNNNIFSNNVCYVTKSYNHRNLFDRNIHSSSKNSFFRNNNSNFNYNKFSKNVKGFNFFRSLFPNFNNGINVTTRQNYSLIRNNVVNLYKGVNVVVLGCIPAHAMYFSTFEYSKKYFSSIYSKNLPIQVQNRGSGGLGCDRKISSNQNIDKKKHDVLNYKMNDLNYFGIAVSGFLATIAHDLIITPIDTLKQRLQLGINKNSLDSLKILRENGIRSLYLSLPITLLMNIPYQIIMICTNEKMKKIYFEYFCGSNNGLGRNNCDSKCTSSSSGNSVSSTDGDIISTRHNSTLTGSDTFKEESKSTLGCNVPCCTQNDEINIHQKNDISESKSTKKEEGSTDHLMNNMKELSDKSNKLIKLFIEQDMDSVNYISKGKKYKESSDTGNILLTTQICLDEEQTKNEILFKNVINKLEKSSNNDLSENYDNKISDSFNFADTKSHNMELKNMWMGNYNKNEFFNKPFNHITSYFVCAGIGGGIAAVVTNPLDVIKTRIQTECFNIKGFNFYRMVSNLYYKEGIRSFFKGSLARMTLCIPASAISWGTYETMKQFFKVNFNSV